MRGLDHTLYFLKEKEMEKDSEGSKAFCQCVCVCVARVYACTQPVAIT